MPLELETTRKGMVAPWTELDLFNAYSSTIPFHWGLFQGKNTSNHSRLGVMLHSYIWLLIDNYIRPSPHEHHGP